MSQQVYRFWDRENAIQYYEEDVSGWYTQTKFETAWVTPDDFLSLPVHADIYDLRCSNSIYSDAETCMYFARYDNSVIEISATTLAINHEQLTGLIVEIDRRMDECLNNGKMNSQN